MKNFLYKILLKSIYLSLLFFYTEATLADTWNLPANISADTAVIKFSVDTTWHTVHGNAKLLSGKAWLENPEDPKSVQLELAIPVSELDTENESRDEEMRVSMDSNLFHKIYFKIGSLPTLCDPKAVIVNSPCKFTALATLTIRDINKNIELPSEITIDDFGNYRIQGTTSFNWLGFGLKDPSIFIAKVHELVVVDFSLFLPVKQVK